MKESILVTDGEQRAALAVVRSLGRAGHAVRVCSSRAPSLAGASRCSMAEAVVPDPLRDPGPYVDEIHHLVQRWSVGTIVPITEAALLALLPERERIPGVVIPFPESEVFRAISDKHRVLETARSVGLAVPRQWVLRDPGDRPSLTATPLAFPLVIKPARSVGGDNGERVKLTVRHVSNSGELHRVLDQLPPAAYPLLLQQRVVGPGVGIFLLLWDGEPRAVFGHRRIREKPPAGGVSVYCESVPADPELTARAVALLQRFGWRGVAMVEFKLDAATGTPYLMEVNGRFWGSLQLAVDAGVDFPALLIAAAHGAPCAPVARYRVGVRNRWWWGDVDHLLARLRRSDAELALPPGFPSRWRSALQFCALWRPGDRNEVLRVSDPVPFVRETLDWLRELKA